MSEPDYAECPRPLGLVLLVACGALGWLLACCVTLYACVGG
jgi:hypothetical protein